MHIWFLPTWFPLRRALPCQLRDDCVNINNDNNKKNNDNNNVVIIINNNT